MGVDEMGVDEMGGNTPTTYDAYQLENIQRYTSQVSKPDTTYRKVSWVLAVAFSSSCPDIAPRSH